MDQDITRVDEEIMRRGFIAYLQGAGPIYTLPRPKFTNLRDLPPLKTRRSFRSLPDFRAEDLDEVVGTLELRLADNIAARQLAALLDVVDTIYFHALWVEQSEGAEGAVIRAEYRPSPDEILWISMLEIGTPNKIKLKGILAALTKVAGFLVAISGVLEAFAEVEYATAHAIGGFGAILREWHQAQYGPGHIGADPQKEPTADAGGRILFQARGALPAQALNVHAEPLSKNTRPH